MTACDVRQRPAVGLACDNDLHRHTLQSLLRDAGYPLALTVVPARLAEKSEAASSVGLWLIDVSAGMIADVLEQLGKWGDQPLLISDPPPLDDSAGFQHWRRRLLEKLACYPGTELPTPAVEQPREVWVLAASMGGPRAVRRFLQALPSDLPVALVYAQHIDAGFENELTRALSRQPYSVQKINGRAQLSAGTVTVVPVDRGVRFLPLGQVVTTDEAWQGRYRPAIDQVIAELARLYRDNLGVVVFSGMCNDGEIGCRVATACGSQVWAQSPASCDCPAMPEAVLDAGLVSAQGEPEQLASRLADRFRPALRAATKRG